MKAWRWYGTSGVLVGKIFDLDFDELGEEDGSSIKNSLSIWRPRVLRHSVGSFGEASSMRSFVMRFSRYSADPFSDGTRENMVGNRLGR